jgi:hypothetical protein
MSFLKTLLNAGINTNDAQVLEQNYSGQPDFVDGLELVARCVGLNEPPGLLAPGGDPWRYIYSHMRAGNNPSTDFIDSIQGYTPEIQLAITGAVTLRAAQIAQWQQQHAVSGKKHKTNDYFQALTNLGYVFKYNLCTHNIELGANKPITDANLSTIHGQLRDLGFENYKAMDDAVLDLSWRSRYHPLRDYLMSLTYAGQDKIAELAGYFQDKYSIFPVLLKRWLIGSVARVMASEQNRMLVLDGPQGLGKDHFARWLASPMPEYFHEGPIQPDDKDHRLRLLSTWIWDVYELGSTTRRADREALKGFLTLQQVSERKPYGHFPIQGQTITSFLGTINDEGGFLSDPTGHRRFMIAKLESIDWSYTKLDCDQVWAQAYDLYISGEPWQLQPGEIDKINQVNDSYQVVDLVQETLVHLFDFDPGNTNLWLSTVEIMNILKDPNLGNLKPGEIDTRRLASAMMKLGLGKAEVKRIGRTTPRGYYGIKRKGP